MHTSSCSVRVRFPGMNTYFIKERLRDLHAAVESALPDSGGGDSRSITDSNKEAQSEHSGLRSQVSFRKVFCRQQRTIH
jgi:hypothetical protein